MPKLFKKRLGKTDMEVSVIGLGGLVLKGEKVSQEQFSDILDYAIDMGVNYIDTSPTYGESEEKIGYALEDLGCRSEVFLATKTETRYTDRRYTADEIKQDLDESLKSLRTDYIDLYQIGYVRHPWELEKILASGGILEALEQFKEQGVIKHIGITGHRNDLLIEALKTGRFDAVMAILNIVQRDAITSGLIDTAKKADVGVIAMRALNNGALRPAHTLRYVLHHVLLNHVDTMVIGMGSITDVAENVALGMLEILDEERDELEKIVEDLENSGCDRCNYCLDCGYADVRTILPLYDYRDKYGLMPEAEKKWHEMMNGNNTERIDYRSAEDSCLRGLPIGEMVEKAMVLYNP